MITDAKITTDDKKQMIKKDKKCHFLKSCMIFANFFNACAKLETCPNRHALINKSHIDIIV